MAEKGKKIRLVYSIVFSVCTVALGALFLTRLWGVYLSNLTGVESDTYSREIVGEQLAFLLPFCLVWLVLAIGAFALSIAFPAQEKLQYRDDRLTLKRLQKRLPENFGGELGAEREKLQSSVRLRMILRLTLLGLSAVCLILLLVYLFTPANFPKGDINGAVISAVAYALPLCIGLFLVAVGVEVFERTALKKELDLAKVLAAGAAKQGLKPAESKEKKPRFWQTERFLFWVRIAVGAAAVAMLIVGLFNGGVIDVLNKAIAICTECIGLG